MIETMLDLIKQGVVLAQKACDAVSDQEKIAGLRKYCDQADRVSAELIKINRSMRKELDTAKQNAESKDDIILQLKNRLEELEK